MIYKVVKDTTGKVIAFGSGDGYEPFVAQGHTLELIENYVHQPSLSDLKADKNAEINAAFELSIATIKSGYPTDEIASWPKQETEARAYQANSLAVTPLLDALSTARGATKSELVTRIIAKSDLFANISGQLIGKRQALEDALNALPLTATKTDVDLIVW